MEQRTQLEVPAEEGGRPKREAEEGGRAQGGRAWGRHTLSTVVQRCSHMLTGVMGAHACSQMSTGVLDVHIRVKLTEAE